MNDAFYTAASGMNAIGRMLENSAHTTVNAHTPGFQRHHLSLQSFGAFLEGAGHREGLVGSRSTVAWEQGNLRATDEPYGVALQGDGFLAVRDGRGTEYFTRNGQFTTDADGKLVTQAGYPVLSEGGGEILVDPRRGPVTIDDGGAISQEGQEIGRLKVVEFERADRALLEPVGVTLYRPTNGAVPQRAQATSVHHGYHEMMRHGLKGTINMIIANKNFEAMQRAIQTLDQAQEQMIRSVE